jgi:hypothetical protein
MQAATGQQHDLVPDRDVRAQHEITADRNQAERASGQLDRIGHDGPRQSRGLSSPQAAPASSHAARHPRSGSRDRCWLPYQAASSAAK